MLPSYKKIQTETENRSPGVLPQFVYCLLIVPVPDHDGGRPMEVNACILITHMVYL